MKKVTQYDDYIKKNRQTREEKEYPDSGSKDVLPFMDRLKRGYNEISPPKELQDKVQTVIKRRRREEMKKHTGLIVKTGAITISAALLTIVILANSSPSVAYAMKKIPVISAITNVVTFRTYQDKTKDFEADINVPRIETGKQEDTKLNEAADEVNKSVKDYTDMLIAQYEAASDGEGHYAMDTSYKVITDNDKLFTLRIDTVVAMGGSDSYSKFYHIDKRSGKVISLKDLFAEGTDYVTLISDNIKTQMREQMKADESVTYFLDDKETEAWNFKEIKEDQNFYTNAKGELVIVFDKYEAAPGYMGCVEFTIPTEITGDLLD